MKCSPGGHSHADRPNWMPADTLAAYLANCREGLENYSQRRAAELLGWSRAKLWRVAKVSRLPDDLFERLIEQARIPSWKEMAAVSDALLDGTPQFETDRCPHCSAVLRSRRLVSKDTAATVKAWLREGRAA